MSVLTYKCKNCGGELIFKPEKQEFLCEYCVSSYKQSELEQLEPEKNAVTSEDNIKSEKTSEQTEDIMLYNCSSCGAEIVTDTTTAATFCYYCHNPVVLVKRLGGEFSPDRIIPFKINKDSAIDKFLEWTKKKMFVPKDFYSFNQIEKLTGVYFPYWIIDSDSDSEMRVNANKTRTWTTGQTVYTETSRYELIRQGEIHLEDVIKTALKKANKKLVESVQPFDEKDLQKFSMTYLSGFQAEKRDVEKTEIADEVDANIKGFCETLLKDTMRGYSRLTIMNSNTTIKNIAWEYSLLPVWTMTYKYNNKTYYYAMNGQTGKTCGKLPVDFKKLALVSSGVFVALIGLLFIGGYLI